MSLNFEIISPQEVIFDQDVDLVILPGIEGDFGVLKNHMPFLTYLRLGLVYIYKDKKLINSFIVNEGIVEVLKDKCTLLTEDITETKDFKVSDDKNELDQLKSKIIHKQYYS
jgi:F-type H+-transporting ATPase subunit epsilon